MSNWKKSPFRSTTTLRDRWPVEQDLLDPWAGDEVFYPIEDLNYSQSLHNEQCLEEYIKKANKKGYSRIPTYDDSYVQKATQLCSLSFLANLTEDWVPDIAMFAEERVLGPFAPYPQLKILCGAILCFSPLLKHGITAAGRFADTQKSAFGSALGIQAKSPCMIWQQTINKEVKPLLPMSERYIPQERVHGLPDSSFFIGRICPTKDGWQASCLLPIPIVGARYVYNMLTMEWLKLQQSDARMFWEDVLRYRSELIYRSALEYCFIHAPKETIQCWDSYLSLVVEEN
jgi:hypothetical protein